MSTINEGNFYAVGRAIIEMGLDMGTPGKAAMCPWCRDVLPDWRIACIACHGNRMCDACWQTHRRQCPLCLLKDQ